MEKKISENEVAEALKSIIDSRIELTTHREIAAWTITAFYLTLLIAVYKYLNEIDLRLHIVIIAIVSIGLFFFAVLIFVHSQYGAHVQSRTEYLIFVRKLFQIISKDEKLDEEKCKVESDKGFYPKFIQDDIKELTSEVHKFSNIWPLVIFKWFFLKKRRKEYMKLQLIESSLYLMISLPTVIVLIWLSYRACSFF